MAKKTTPAAKKTSKSVKPMARKAMKNTKGGLDITTPPAPSGWNRVRN